MINPHSRNQNGKGGRFRGIALLTILGLVLAGIAVWGSARCYGALKSVYDEQFAIDSAVDEINIKTGKNVSEQFLRNFFELTNGVNVSTIPFKKKRDEFLKIIHSARDVRIECHLPRRVDIEVLEREPIARLAARASRPYKTVVDYSGHVFSYKMNEIALLPIIRLRTKEINVRQGEELAGMNRAAVHLVYVASQPEFPEVSIQEVVIANEDYLIAVLDDSSMLKISWDDMGNDSDRAMKSLRRQLTYLCLARKSNASPHTKIWNATNYKDGRIYANDPSRALTD